MRHPLFHSEHLLQYLRQHKIATLPQLKQALGTSVAVTVFRKLKPLSYRSSYSHRGAYYTLDEITHFDQNGLWSLRSVWFSRSGTLLATVEEFVRRSSQGYFAQELAEVLHVEAKDPLRQLVQQGRLARQSVAGLYLYCAPEAAIRRQQLLRRQTLEAIPGSASAAVSAHELKAAIILFYSLLDERQRRLYAGLESLKLGHGGDQKLAELLALDPHTIARGRQQLLAQEVDVDRVRRAGGGRKPVEKKRPTSSPKSKC